MIVVAFDKSCECMRCDEEVLSVTLMTMRTTALYRKLTEKQG